MSSETFDLGHGVTMQFTRWAPDRDLNPQHAGRPDIDPVGYITDHPQPDGSPCAGGTGLFDLPGVRDLFPGRAVWTVESWEPLTLSPSLLCSACGHHGFVRQGQWVPA